MFRILHLASFCSASVYHEVVRHYKENPVHESYQLPFLFVQFPRIQQEYLSMQDHKRYDIYTKRERLIHILNLLLSVSFQAKMISYSFQRCPMSIGFVFGSGLNYKKTKCVLYNLISNYNIVLETLEQAKIHFCILSEFHLLFDNDQDIFPIRCNYL